MLLEKIIIFSLAYIIIFLILFFYILIYQQKGFKVIKKLIKLNFEDFDKFHIIIAFFISLILSFFICIPFIKK
mgnify:CR=1 FL=1